MSILIKKLSFRELDEAVRVEEAAMKGNTYLRDVAEEFFSDQEGAMLGGYVDGVLAGIAKYTILPDHTAWLETLRVHPDYQRRGVGRKFYEEFVRLSKEKNVPSMAMYTGLKNIPSYSLARLFDLDTAGRYREFQLDLKEFKKEIKEAGHFVPVNEGKACEILHKIEEKYEHFLIFNRTFMHANDEVFSAMAREGKVLCDAKSKSVLVFGNRFLGKRSVQIAMMAGEYETCMNYAVEEGRKRGVPQVVAMAPLADEALGQVLTKYGFHAAADLQVMDGQV